MNSTSVYIFIYLFMNCRCSFAEHAQASSWTIFAGELRLQLITCCIYTHPNMIVNLYIYIECACIYIYCIYIYTYI